MSFNVILIASSEVVIVIVFNYYNYGKFLCEVISHYRACTDVEVGQQFHNSTVATTVYFTKSPSCRNSKHVSVTPDLK